jgi:hypothetical protein
MVKWVGVGVLVAAVVFGAGFWLGRAQVDAARAQVQAAQVERDRAHADLARASVPLELCRALPEIERSNFGNAADRLAAARDAAKSVPDLRVLEGRLQELVEGARKLDPELGKRVAATLAEVSRVSK